MCEREGRRFRYSTGKTVLNAFEVAGREVSEAQNKAKKKERVFDYFY